MKQFYLNLSSFRARTNLLFFVTFLAVSFASSGQVYYGTLSGAIEVPVNSSPGTGKTVVTIDPVAMTMRVQVAFSGLVAQTSLGQPSGVTAAHIHAPTATPFLVTGTAGVATQLPTFVGFPQGPTVRAGTYDNTFDMTQTSSYNTTPTGFLNANGGTPASAFAALRTFIAQGRSYLNIHSNAFGGGEIRAFLIPCPAITVTIPDAFALPQGVLPNTVYPAYAPASSLTLQANVSGGTGPYAYSWSNSSTSSSITVNPTVATQYSVTVTDNNGCPGTASKTVNVVDVSGGKKDQKIMVCHKERNTLTIGTSGVASHLDHGDMLGSCEVNSSNARLRGSEQIASELSVRALPNPSRNYFDLQINGEGGPAWSRR